MENDIFRDLLETCLIMYLNDLLIYSKKQEKHDIHELLILKLLRAHGLYAKLKGGFVNYVISSEGIFMDPAKV